MCGLAPSRILGAIRYVAGGWDAATIRFLPTGTVQALIGTSPHGQGHVTTFSQIVADRLGVRLDEVEVLHGDTTRLAARDGHVRQPQPRRRRRRALARGARRSSRRRSAIAAHQLEVRRGRPRVRGRHVHGRRHDRSVTVKEAAFAAWTAHNLPDGMEPGLEATRRLRPAELQLARRARTSPSSRSTRRPAPSSSAATSRSTTSAT